MRSSVLLSNSEAMMHILMIHNYWKHQSQDELNPLARKLNVWIYTLQKHYYQYESLLEEEILTEEKSNDWKLHCQYELLIWEEISTEELRKTRKRRQQYVSYYEEEISTEELCNT